MNQQALIDMGLITAPQQAQSTNDALQAMGLITAPNTTAEIAVVNEVPQVPHLIMFDNPVSCPRCTRQSTIFYGKNMQDKAVACITCRPSIIQQACGVGK